MLPKLLDLYQLTKFLPFTHPEESQQIPKDEVHQSAGNLTRRLSGEVPVQENITLSSSEGPNVQSEVYSFTTLVSDNRLGSRVHHEERGASRTLNLIEWDKLWNINKKIIDPVCPQHTAIVDEGRIKNMRSPNVEVALMDWGNAIVEEIKKDSDGNVTELSGKLHLEGYVKAAQLKLTWLPEINELTPLTLVEFGYLITRKKDNTFNCMDGGDVINHIAKEAKDIYEVIDREYSPIPITAHRDIDNPDKLCKTEEFTVIRHSIGNDEEFVTVGTIRRILGFGHTWTY
ncbi:glutamate--tRNA ligase, cytoplasmic [Tanacetum coccineum]